MGVWSGLFILDYFETGFWKIFRTAFDPDFPFKIFHEIGFLVTNNEEAETDEFTYQKI